MKPWLKNVIRKQRQQQRKRVSIDTIAESGELKFTDPLEWTNLIAERVGYARYLANKKNEELSAEATHEMMAGVIREAQEEILSSPDILAFYLSRHETETTRHALEGYIKATDRFIPEVVTAIPPGASEPHDEKTTP